jgi:hypothetical protein
MIDPSKPIKVSDLLNELDALHDIAQNYIMLSDTSINATFLKMIEAVNAIDEHGWEVVGISGGGDGMTMYAMARRIIKAKN